MLIIYGGRPAAFGAIILATVACLLPVMANADGLAPGLDWLDRQKGADGVYRTDESVAAPPQVVAEATFTRALFAEMPEGLAPGAQVLLADWSVENTEFLALYAGTMESDADEVEGLLQALQDRQNADGGFADASGHTSGVLPTAAALIALHRVSVDVSDVIQPAAAYLLEQQGEDGGWADGGNASSLYTTALALQSLIHFSGRYNLAEAIGKGTDFLLSARQTDYGFESSWEGAHALLALIPALPDPGIHGPTLRWLRDQQSGNGSWDDDVYATALALRVLHVADRLADPDRDPDEPPGAGDSAQGTVSGRILDVTDDSPLTWARVTAPDVAEANVSVSASGAFELLLPPSQDLTLVYSAEGFLQATQEVKVTAGGTLNVGPVRLAPMPDRGRLLGGVTDREDGKAIPGAVVTVTDDTQLAIPVDSAGRYELALPGGSYSVTVEADGFHPVGADIELSVGQTLRFSPALVSISQPTDDEPGAIVGQIQDADTGAPLADAQVEIHAAGRFVSTGADGHFRLDALDAGTLEVSIARSGYRGASFAVVLPPSTTAEVGTVALPRLEQAETSRLLGTVSDSDSGDALAGASVTAAGGQARTDTSGHFQIEGVEERSFRLRVSAEGYVSQEIPVEVTEPGTLHFAVSLEPHRRGGLLIAGFQSDRNKYDAHNEAALSVDLENTGSRTQVLRLYLAVLDDEGNQLSERPVTPVFLDDDHHHHDGDDHGHELSSARISLEPGDQFTETFSWFTEARPPGHYQLKIRAYEAFNGDLLGERSLPVGINDTRQIELVSVRPEPRYLTQGAQDDVNFQVLVQHRSNVAFASQVTFELLDPDEAALFTGTVPLDLVPERIDELRDLPGTAVQVEQAGEYSIRIVDVTGAEPLTVHGQPLFVAPGTRVEIRQDRTPGSIAPDGSYRIDLEIRLDGKEQ